MLPIQSERSPGPGKQQPSALIKRTANFYLYFRSSLLMKLTINLLNIIGYLSIGVEIWRKGKAWRIAILARSIMKDLMAYALSRFAKYTQYKPLIGFAASVDIYRANSPTQCSIHKITSEILQNSGMVKILIQEIIEQYEQQSGQQSADVRKQIESEVQNVIQMIHQLTLIAVDKLEPVQNSYGWMDKKLKDIKQPDYTWYLEVAKQKISALIPKIVQDKLFSKINLANWNEAIIKRFDKYAEDIWVKIIGSKLKREFNSTDPAFQTQAEHEYQKSLIKKQERMLAEKNTVTNLSEREQAQQQALTRDEQKQAEIQAQQKKITEHDGKQAIKDSREKEKTCLARQQNRKDYDKNEYKKDNWAANIVDGMIEMLGLSESEKTSLISKLTKKLKGTHGRKECDKVMASFIAEQKNIKLQQLGELFATQQSQINKVKDELNITRHQLSDHTATRSSVEENYLKERQAYLNKANRHVKDKFLEDENDRAQAFKKQSGANKPSFVGNMQVHITVNEMVKELEPVFREAIKDMDLSGLSLIKRIELANKSIRLELDENNNLRCRVPINITITKIVKAAIELPTFTVDFETSLAITDSESFIKGEVLELHTVLKNKPKLKIFRLKMMDVSPSVQKALGSFSSTIQSRLQTSIDNALSKKNIVSLLSSKLPSGSSLKNLSRINCSILKVNKGEMIWDINFGAKISYKMNCSEFQSVVESQARGLELSLPFPGKKIVITNIKDMVLGENGGFSFRVIDSEVGGVIDVNTNVYFDSNDEAIKLDDFSLFSNLTDRVKQFFVSNFSTFNNWFSLKLLIEKELTRIFREQIDLRLNGIVNDVPGQPMLHYDRVVPIYAALNTEGVNIELEVRPYDTDNNFNENNQASSELGRIFTEMREQRAPAHEVIQPVTVSSMQFSQ